MTFKTKVELDREICSVIAEVEGDVTKHFGLLQVADFQSDITLSRDEIDLAHEALLERAGHESDWFFPEEESDCWKNPR